MKSNPTVLVIAAAWLSVGTAFAQTRDCGAFVTTTCVQKALGK